MPKRTGKIESLPFSSLPFSEKGLRGLGYREGARIESPLLNCDYAEMEKKIMGQVAERLTLSTFKEWIRENARETKAHREVERLGEIVNKMVADMWLNLGVEAMSITFSNDIDEEGCGPVFAALMEQDDER